MNVSKCKRARVLFLFRVIKTEYSACESAKSSNDGPVVSWSQLQSRARSEAGPAKMMFVSPMTETRDATGFGRESSSDENRLVVCFKPSPKDEVNNGTRGAEKRRSHVFRRPSGAPVSGGSFAFGVFRTSVRGRAGAQGAACSVSEF